MEPRLVGILALVIALSLVAGCGGSSSNPAAEAKAVEKKLAAAEEEEAACQGLLPEEETALQIYSNELNRQGKAAGLSVAKTEELVHNLELKVRELSDCIEEEQELEIKLNHQLAELSEQEEGFAARKANEAAE